MAYKLAVLEILKNFYCIGIYYMSVLSLHIESTDSMIKVYSAHIHMQASRNLNRGLKLLESQQQVLLTGMTPHKGQFLLSL